TSERAPAKFSSRLDGPCVAVALLLLPLGRRGTVLGCRHPMAHGGDDDRRGALKTIVIAGSAIFGAGTAGPALKLAMAPALETTHTEERWIRVARLADLKDGEPKRVPVISEVVDALTKYNRENIGAVWLLKNRDEVRALSVTCPHLGCGVERSAAGFGCPCHT